MLLIIPVKKYCLLQYFSVISVSYFLLDAAKMGTKVESPMGELAGKPLYLDAQATTPLVSNYNLLQYLLNQPSFLEPTHGMFLVVDEHFQPHTLERKCMSYRRQNNTNRQEKKWRFSTLMTFTKICLGNKGTVRIFHFLNFMATMN